MKRTIMIVCTAVLFLWIFSCFILSTGAAEVKKPEGTRYYTSICIREGDSLWSIANQFRENSQLSIPEYIEDLKRMNGLQKETIHAGQYLTVVYYK